MIEVTLIRHGETEYNKSLRLQGSLDSPLTELGREQALRLGQTLAVKDNYRRIDAWFSSPQGRAMATSNLIREGMSADLPAVQCDDRIREIFCGSLEGHHMQGIDSEILRRLRTETDFAYPDGESIDDVIVRARSFWEDLQVTLQSVAAQEGRDYHAVIVSHGNFLRCLTTVILDLPAKYAVRVVLENTGVCYFRSLFDGAQVKMLGWNDRSHMLP